MAPSSGEHVETHYVHAEVTAQWMFFLFTQMSKILGENGDAVAS